MKPKKPSSKYEVSVKHLFQRKDETFVKKQSQSGKSSSKYEAKETFFKIRCQGVKPSSKYEVKATFAKIQSQV
jgi:DNA-binding transcriptional regulator GbsR (MarR family)